MIKRLIVILVAVSALVLKSSAEPHFYTNLHRMIAQTVKLEVLDTLGICRNETYDYKGKTLRVKTNHLGDISHIGYKLFHDDVMAYYESTVFFDFLERYFLELDLKLDHRSPADRMSLDKVDCQGNLNLLSKITENTPFTLDFLERRMYKIKWTIDKQTLSMTVPADCQLLLGANAIELEEIFKRDICRLHASIPDVKQEWSHTSTSQDGEWIIANSGTYLSDEIRSDVFLRKKNGELTLAVDPKKPIQSVKNILLTGMNGQILPMQLKINQYGYKNSDVSVSLQQYLDYCKKEKCQLFVGIKTSEKDRITATLFAVNNFLGYNHVLSVDFPLGILSGDTTQVIRSVLYAYIPLQNVTEKFFSKNNKKYDL